MKGITVVTTAPAASRRRRCLREMRIGASVAHFRPGTGITGGPTTRVTLARSTIPPLSAVMGSWEGPKGHLRAVVTLMIGEPEPFTDVGPHGSVVPRREPRAVSWT